MIKKIINDLVFFFNFQIDTSEWSAKLKLDLLKKIDPILGSSGKFSKKKCTRIRKAIYEKLQKLPENDTKSNLKLL